MSDGVGSDRLVLDTAAFNGIVVNIIESAKIKKEAFFKFIEGCGLKIAHSESLSYIDYHEKGMLASWKEIADLSMEEQKVFHPDTAYSGLSRFFCAGFEQKKLEVKNLPIHCSQTNNRHREYFNELDQCISKIFGGSSRYPAREVGLLRYEIDYGVEISTVHLSIHVVFGHVFVRMPFQAQSMKEYYDSAPQAVKEYIFENVNKYMFCSGDFCTGMLEVYLELDGRKKKICHSIAYCPNRLYLKCTDKSLPMIKGLISALYKGHTPKDTDISFEISYRNETMVIGYLHKANPLSQSTPDFIKECFSRADSPKSRLDILMEIPGARREYYGVTCEFIDGLNYHYVLGITCESDQIPETLPDGVVAVGIDPGESIEIKSVRKDYNRIWEYFEYHAKKRASRKFASKRYALDIFNEEGCLEKVAIPVTKENLTESLDIGYEVCHTQDMRIAGIRGGTEEYYRGLRDITKIDEFILSKFPESRTLIKGKIHAYLGKTYIEFAGVLINPGDAIPDGLEEINVKGGWWYKTRHRYFNGLDTDSYVPDNWFKTKNTVVLAHPRAFLCINNYGRSGYSETMAPIKENDDYIYEKYEGDDILMIGKEEDMERSVEELDYNRFRTRGNGEFLIAFTNLKRFFTPSLKNKPFFIGYRMHEGMQEAEGHTNGYTTRKLPGGSYVKVSQAKPNGELDWCMVSNIALNLKNDTGGEVIDNEREFYAVQKNGSFEIHVPVQ